MPKKGHWSAMQRWLRGGHATRHVFAIISSVILWPGARPSCLTVWAAVAVCRGDAASASGVAWVWPLAWGSV